MAASDRREILVGTLAVAAGGAIAPLSAWARTSADLRTHAIVIPDAPTAAERSAAALLARFLGEAAGRPPEIAAEASRGSRPAILLGATRIGRRLAPQTPSLGTEGFVLTPVGDDLVISGGDAALEHAVYRLAELWGFRLYTSDDPIRRPGASNELPTRQVVARPPVGYRTQSYADTAKAPYPAWHGLSDETRWGLFVHTFDTLIPPDRYGTSNPEFFSLVDGRRIPGSQLCLSNPRMRAELAANLGRLIRAKPDATYWSVSQNDNDRYCRCDACAAIDARYGGVPSASVLNFTNLVARSFPDKTISTLAYWYSRTPPTGLRADRNVNIMLCNIESRRHAPVDQTDPAFARDLQAWGRIANDIIIWDYNIQFTNLLSPFPNLHTIKPNVDFYVRNGVTALFMQANSQSGGEFAALRAYLIAKLMWDPGADDAAIIDDFLTGYYGAAAPHIRAYIDLMRRRLIDSGHKLDIFGSPEAARDTYLTADAMAAYDAQFDRAERAVATSPVHARRVAAARLPLTYARIQIARSEPVDSPRGLYVSRTDGPPSPRPDLTAAIRRFAAAAAAAGTSRLRERSTTPADYGASYARIVSRMAAMPESRSYARAVTTGKEMSGRGVPDVARLTDGLFGSWESWSDRDPNWLTFTGTDMDVIVDLGAVVPIREFSVEFLNVQAQPDWNTLILPTDVAFSHSVDGRSFTPEARVTNPHDPNPRVNPAITSVPVQMFRVQASPADRARFVRVQARSPRRMPAWHLMAGRPAVIVTDQIVIM